MKEVAEVDGSGGVMDGQGRKVIKETGGEERGNHVALSGFTETSQMIRNNKSI